MCDKIILWKKQEKPHQTRGTQTHIIKKTKKQCVVHPYGWVQHHHFPDGMKVWMHENGKEARVWLSDEASNNEFFPMLDWHHWTDEPLIIRVN